MSFTRITTPALTYIGWGALENLSSEVAKYGHPVLFVVDPIIEKIGVLDKIISPLKNSRISYEIYTDIIPEPTIDTGENLVEFARKGNYSLIVGIGGGSALDMAKLAAVMIDNPGKVANYLNLTGSEPIKNKGIPKILIPTTAGTGAEVTNISVLALEHTKDVIVHDYLLADTAIIDPELTMTMPKRTTAATGADALTHAMESFLSVNANSYSEGLALEAIRIIGKSLQQAVHHGDNKEARADMTYGSYLAGLSFFNAGVGAIHALAYPLGGQFHIAHGESNAVLIPYVLGYIRKSCEKKLAIIYHTLTGHKYIDLSDKQASTECISFLADLMNDIGIPKNLGGYQIPSSATKGLAKDGILQKRLLARCPMTLTEEDILKIYDAAAAGSVVEA